MAIQVLPLAGNPYSRGIAFGTACRASIGTLIADWLESLRAAGIDDPTAYIRDFLGNTNFLPAIREYTPDLLEEVRGIATATSNELDIVLACQFMDEEWAFRATRLQDSEPLQKCSSVALRTAADESLIGQNMDLGVYTEGHQIALNITTSPNDPSELIFSVHGMIGLMGVNSCGLGVCVNSLPQLPVAQDGLPVTFVLRKLLKARSAAEAIACLKSVQHATGQHYLIADAAEIRSYEAAPHAVMEYHPPIPGRILHTNHPLAAPGSRASDEYEANTAARLTSLVTRLAEEQADLAAIQQALSSHDDPDNPVCRDRPGTSRGMEHNAFTTGSMISRLRAGRPIESWLTAGPPTPADYFKVTLPSPPSRSPV